VLKTAAWTLRQPRYAALAAAMLVVALGCIAAGTWQISRFDQSVRVNDALKRNAHAATTPLTAGLVPIVGQGSAPGRDAIRYRTVTASGTYQGQPEFLRNQTQSGNNGFYVVNPLRTTHGVLLVVRGFVDADEQGNPPAVAATPAGTVSLTGRLQTIDSAHDSAGSLPDRELESINAAEQAARLNTPVYNAYLTLNSGQPGTSGVQALPAPDLSNPAGGAYEAQHFAYIIQWYLFALLALAAPFAIGRREVRDARERFLGLDAGNDDLGLTAGDDEPGPGGIRALPPGAATSGGLALRSSSQVARRIEVSPARWRRGTQLADRYGRSLGLGIGPSDSEPPEQSTRSAPAGRPPDIGPYETVNSATTPHRSPDAFHGSYNDHLWQLALADGAVPDAQPRPAESDAAARAAIEQALPAGPTEIPRSGEHTPDAD
jgi:cytochrome oxidase assembly protein ShyY1